MKEHQVSRWEKLLKAGLRPASLGGHPVRPPAQAGLGGPGRPPRSTNFHLLGLALALLLALLLAFASMIAPTASSASTTLLISEVQTAAAADADVEFVEIYNATTAAISLNGYKVVYRSANGTSDVMVHTFASDATIPAHGHYLLVHAGKDVGVTPDATFTTSIGRTGGGLAIRNSSDAIVDSLGWGTATNIFVEGSAATAAGNDQSMERKPGSTAGNGADTDNNLADFQVLATPQPQNTASAPTPATPTSYLHIAKSAPASVETGRLFTYTLVATNHISDTAHGVVITDALPLSVTIAAISDGGIHLGGHVVSWTVTSLTNEASVTRTVAVTAPAAVATLVNSDYGVWASNWPTRTVGAPVQTMVALPGGLTTIYQIQYTTHPAGDSPLVGQVVTTTGIVYALYSQGFAIAEASGPWHGIYVYYPNTPKPAVGDLVRVKGTVQEYYGFTELGNYAWYTVLSSGNTPYAQSEVQTGQIATGAATAEGYEGVLVAVQNITVTNPNPDAPNDYGEWVVDDGSGGVRVDDWASYSYQPALNDALYLVRGMLNYSFSNFKIEPRGDDDVLAVAPTGLLLSKSAPLNVSPGAELTYILTVQNSTGITLTDLVVTDVVPAAHATFARALDGGVWTGGEVRWTASSLADQASLSLRFVVTATGSAGSLIQNESYAAWAANWATPTTGAPVLTVIGDYTPIYLIQGQGCRSPLVGQTVKTVGVVQGFFQGNSSYVGDFNGFYIQDRNGDGNPATSDGIFVKHATSVNPGVSVGDLVTVTGQVDEFSEYDGAACSGDDCQTQVYISSASAVQNNGPAGRPPAIPVNPPGDPGQSRVYWESLEGMWVTAPGTSTVVGPTSYGTVMVISGSLGLDRVIRTGPYAGMPVGVRHWKKFGALDDGSDPPNLIVGSVITNVDGPLAFSYGSYVIATQAGDAWSVVHDQPAPSTPPTWPAPGADEFTVAAFNTYNFDTGSAPTYADKRAKVVAVIRALNGPTFLSLEEIAVEQVITDVLTDLNVAGYPYAYAYSHADIGGHGVALLWRTDRVTDVVWSTQYQTCSPIGSSSSSYDPLWDTCRAQGQYPLFARRPVVVTGTVTLSDRGLRVVVIANHFKAKGTPTDDQRRLQEAQLVAGVVDGLVAGGSPYIVVLGDLNDFEDAPPLKALYASGNLTNTWYTLPAEARYSYIYQGVSQVLDHVLISPALRLWLRAAGPLHIDADFPFRPYSNDPAVVWRTSDHDPVIATFLKVHTLYLPLVARGS